MSLPIDFSMIYLIFSHPQLAILLARGPFSADFILSLTLASLEGYFQPFITHSDTLFYYLTHIFAIYVVYSVSTFPSMWSQWQTHNRSQNQSQRVLRNTHGGSLRVANAFMWMKNKLDEGNKGPSKQIERWVGGTPWLLLFSATSAWAYLWDMEPGNGWVSGQYGNQAQMSFYRR